MAKRTASVLGGVALTMVAALGVTQPVTTVQLAALIIGASSTNPSGDGVEDFYGGLYQQGPGETVVANFFTGPPGIYLAIYDNRDDDNNVVLSSGWGAANTSLLLSYLKATNDPVLADPTLYVLDNNVASPNGGFGTRLPAFAVIGVNPIPTPTDPGVPVVNVVYEYDINSNIPAYLWNAPAMANSLMAYFERRLNQESLDFPIDADGQVRDCDAACEATLDSGGTIERTMADGQTVRISRVDDTTYVGYESTNLPLVAPLRAFGEPGNRLADAMTPALSAAVDYGYPDNDPLADPDKYVSARLVPTRQETERFVDEFRAGIDEGVEILRGDDEPSTVTRPLVRKSLDFSPKPSRDSKPRRPGATMVESVVEGVRTLARRLQAKADEAPEPAAGSAETSSAGPTEG
ncbi:PE-PPE domain-containing protein [Mycolicibacterium wolinskyi]|uniref:PE-PPE domain-containing protein n=1 Tax=Mycolicibacterium wolinskyi TaxID=59750 RepID=UPI0039177C2B